MPLNSALHFPDAKRKEPDLISEVNHGIMTEMALLVRLCRKTETACFGTVERMRERQPVLFRGRHFRSEVILLCVRWYLRYPLS